MTDNLPPQPPPHDSESMMQQQQEQQPTPSRSVQRTKTVRNNLGNAGNKVRGLFKKQSNKEVENAKSVPREDTPSYSSGTRNWERSSIPRSFSGQDVFREIPERPSSQATDSNTPTDDHPYESRAPSAYIPNDYPPAMSTSAAPPRNSNDGNGSDTMKFAETEETEEVSAEELMKELEKVNADIARVKKEVATEAEKKQALQSMLEEARRIVQTQEQEYTQIEHKYFEDTRPIRATDDDLSTIRETFKLLKYSIARIIMTLNRKADKAQATEKFEKLWPELKVTENGELEPSHINLLAEKIVHDHLVKHIFRCPIYPGLEVNDAYSSVSKWLTQHGSQFPIRLRQQLAAIVAKSGKDSQLYKAAQSEKQKIIDIIYNDLADVYHPFLRDNDAKVEEEKRYYTKITDIVEKAMKLSVAIRGQEVDIKTLEVQEGHDEFDEETMVDVKGKTNGIVRFCICPPFTGGDGEHGFVEKGKVVLA